MQSTDAQPVSRPATSGACLILAQQALHRAWRSKAAASQRSRSLLHLCQQRIACQNLQKCIALHTSKPRGHNACTSTSYSFKQTGICVDAVTLLDINGMHRAGFRQCSLRADLLNAGAEGAEDTVTAQARRCCPYGLNVHARNKISATRVLTARHTITPCMPASMGEHSRFVLNENMN